jgi:GTP cyclohydrolase II
VRRTDAPVEVAAVTIPTPAGEFLARAFEGPSGFVHLALIKGALGNGESVLTRLHSECVTGDAIGSLRCDCGVQLRVALQQISAEGRGVLVYATGHEGRGIGLINKLRAYMEQEQGADTLDANLRLGLPGDARDYTEVISVLSSLGVRSVRLLTNNPAKVAAVKEAGLIIENVEAIRTAPHSRNLPYLRSKEDRLGHVRPAAQVVARPTGETADVGALLGRIRPVKSRPYVVLKYAQTLDGRIATTDGDSKWISGEEERRVSHALRAACDAILVGVGTVVRDDPKLTVRLVPGTSPQRVVLDSKLRIPMSAKVLDETASTIIVTGGAVDPRKSEALRSRRVSVISAGSASDGVDIGAALLSLRNLGIRCLLVEGGARVITSMLASGVVDRLIVSIAPTIIGAGTDAVGDLSIRRIADGLTLGNRSIHAVGDDVLLAWDVAPNGAAAGAPLR